MTQAIIVDNQFEAEHYGYSEPEPVPEPMPQGIVVCNAMDNMCQEVMMDGDAHHLDTVEFVEIPINTRDGQVMTQAVIVDNQFEADYYGV